MVIGFIGLGLIGGSIAKTARRTHPDITIIAYNRTKSVLDAALADGTIDLAVPEIGEPFRRCDYIFVCVPVVTMHGILEKLKPWISETTILTDVGSTKCDIHEVVRSMGLEKQFIGGHPMAGSEKTGYANATDRMIENAYYILTPGADMPIRQVSAFSAFISSLGALPLVLSAEDHDFITAAISHVPHVISASLVNMVHDLDGPEEYMKQIAAGGFKDITRISSSSPQMWQEICLANEDDLCIVLDRFIRKLTDFRFAIRNGNGEKLLEYFTECKTYRDSFSDDVRAGIRKENRIYLDIADRPGALAEVASVLAKNDISIENIGIVHNRDFEQGVLHIEFYDPEARAKAVKVLKENSYSVYEDK